MAIVGRHVLEIRGDGVLFEGEAEVGDFIRKFVHVFSELNLLIW